MYIDTIYDILDSIELQNAIKTLQKLKSLKILNDIKETLWSKSIDNILHLKSVKEFEINIDSDINFQVPFSFGQLETLKMQFFGELNAFVFFSFIDNDPTIKVLNLEAFYLSVMDQRNIAKSLPLLESIIFEHFKLSANQAAQFMSHFKYLRYFRFIIEEKASYDDFRTLLNDDWECEINWYGRISVEKCGPMKKTRRIN